MVLIGVRNRIPFLLPHIPKPPKCGIFPIIAREEGLHSGLCFCTAQTSAMGGRWVNCQMELVYWAPAYGRTSINNLILCELFIYSR